QWDPELATELDQHLVARDLLRQVVILDLEVEAVAEDAEVLGRDLAAALVVAGLEGPVDLAREAAARADQAAVQLREELLVDPRLEVEALAVRERHELAEVAVPREVHREQDHVEVAARLVVVALGDLLLLAGARREIHLAADDRLHAGGGA